MLDPFSSQSQEELTVTHRAELPQFSPTTGSQGEGPEYAGSPAYSMDRHMADLTEMALRQSSSILDQSQPPPPAPYSGDAALLACFSALLQQELSKACTAITAEIRGDFHCIGERLDTIEFKVDGTVGRVNQNTKMISSLQDQLDQANTKIEDLKNRSRLYNFRLCRSPELITDLEDAVHILMQDLIPGISPYHLAP